MEVVSLNHHKQEKMRKDKQKHIPLEERVADLERDMLRLIDASIHLDNELGKQNKFLNKILRLLKSALSSSSEK